MPSNTKAFNLMLWTAQVLLALLFLFAGVTKLAMPAAVLTQQSGLPIGFLRFVAVAEVAGALGLVLPGLLRVRHDLTPLAVLGLIVIMAGATTLTAVTQGPAPAAFPLAVGMVLGMVLLGRRSWMTLPGGRVPDGAAIRS